MSKNARDYTNYKKALNSKNVILLGIAGSDLLGLSSKDTDEDQMGIYLEEPKDLIGFAPLDTVIYRTATDRTGITNAPSTSGDIDLTLYGLRKYLNLALGGNPNLINLLFTPENKCLIRSFWGEELQKLAPKIISKQVGKAFLGYLHAQRLRLIGSKGQKAVNRPDLEEAYGYDTKYAMHMIRLGLQGKQLLKTGKLTFPLDPDWTTYLMKIRTGQESFAMCIRQAEVQEECIREFMHSSNLPDRPDYDAVEKWMINTYREYWKGLQEV